MLIELIRKIENRYVSALDIRSLSTIILHRLRIDGIQRAPGVRETDDVTPYRAKGLMSPKFQLLLTMVSNVSSSIDLRKALSETELCQLHRIISTSVEPWERGDENRVCPPMRALVGGERPDPFNGTRHIKYVLLINRFVCKKVKCSFFFIAIIIIREFHTPAECNRGVQSNLE